MIASPMLSRLVLPEMSSDCPTAVKEPKEAPVSVASAAFPSMVSAPRTVVSAANAPVMLVSNASSTFCRAWAASLAGLEL